MVDNFGFSRLPVIRFGVGTAGEAPLFAKGFGTKLLLVTGSSSFIRSSRRQRILDGLDAVGIRYEIVSISGEPTTLIVDETAARFRDRPPEAVMAVGGGSVLDAGKAISAMIPVKGTTWDYLEGNPAISPHPGLRIPFIALPTTAGTGSEATKNAVLSTPGIPSLKRSLRHDNFVPDIAIVDPGLTLGCPPGVTAAGGLDAITQLLEAFVSTQSSAITDALAYSGLARGFRSIRRVMADGNDIEARTDMAYAAMISGIVLANAGLGAVHGFASVLGGYFQIPHGVICGTLLGEVTRCTINRLKESGKGNPYLKKYATAGRLICGGKKRNDDYYIACLADELDSIIEDLYIPGLGQYGIKHTDAAMMASETGMKNNPAELGIDELERILLSRL